MEKNLKIKDNPDLNKSVDDSDELIDVKTTTFGYGIKALMDEMRALRIEVSKLSQIIRQSNMTSQLSYTEELEEHKTEYIEKDFLDEEQVIATYYLSRPRQDGSFSDSSKLEVFDPNRSAYKLMLIDDELNTAKFEIIDNEKNLVQAKSSQETFIDPVCEKRNIITEQTSMIVTEKRGLVTLDEGRWIVKEKAIISFQ